jgi:hypothetical protein
MLILQLLQILVNIFVSTRLFLSSREDKLSLHPRLFNPQVQLDEGTYIGVNDGVVNKFMGIPFGKSTYVAMLALD